MIKRWGLSLLLLISLLGSFWFIEKLSLDMVNRNSNAFQQEPDYVVDNFTTVTMNERGLPKRRLQARRMVHYSATGTSDLEEPYLVFFAMENHDKPGKKIADKSAPRVYPIWHAKSEQGRVVANGKTIFLLGKVYMWQNDSTGTIEVDVRTRNLKIIPDANYGETDEMAVIRTVTGETRGVGMRAHIKPGRMELLSQVRTVYKEITH